jgi:hypothetical protein
MRASYGTTKYCMSFLRSQSCGDHNCKNLHEWGDEKDCFTKEDLTTLCVSGPLRIRACLNLANSNQKTYYEGLGEQKRWKEG